MLLKNSNNFVNNIRISRDVAPRIILKGDAQRLRQVFWNLLINSCQAMPNGGEITISAMPAARADDDTTWCEITIADGGLGIAHEYLDKVFDPFFTTKTGGTGLGLAIAYRIIQDHQGYITLDSKLGEGTQFTIRLPMLGKSVYAPVLNGKPQG